MSTLLWCHVTYLLANTIQTGNEQVTREGTRRDDDITITSKRRCFGIIMPRLLRRVVYSKECPPQTMIRNNDMIITSKWRFDIVMKWLFIYFKSGPMLLMHWEYYWAIDMAPLDLCIPLVWLYCTRSLCFHIAWYFGFLHFATLYLFYGDPYIYIYIYIRIFEDIQCISLFHDLTLNNGKWVILPISLW